MPAIAAAESNNSLGTHGQPPPSLVADKQPSGKRHADPIPNGATAKMSSELPNGTGPSRGLLNGAPVQPASADKTLMHSISSERPDRGVGLSNDRVYSPSQDRGSSADVASRDDGYFASVHTTEQQHGCRTTKVHMGIMNTAESKREAQKDFQPPPPPSLPPPPPPPPPQKTSSEWSQHPFPTDGNLQVPSSAYRVSSPAAFNHNNPAPNQHPYRLQQRHTLEVPKISSSRPREYHSSSTSTDDVAIASGRFSPNTPTRRRGSMSLVRRATRSINSDMHLEEVPQDEDAVRWAEHIKQKRASKRKRREDEDDDNVIVGTKVDQNHVNFVMAYNMLTGIRFCVSRTNAKMNRELTDADFDAKHKFSFDITGNELTPSAKYDFKFKDYAPWVFRHLRATFALDPADYLVSLTSKYILSELGSPGKSGSFFYFSRDYKFIIKTIHHAEHKFLRRILKDYYNHVRENPNTLLSQFYGLHRVKMPYGRKVHFVVMNNLFPPHRDIHTTFDLKGSTIGRDFKEEELESNPRATLKDLNWLRRNMHLEFGPTKKKAFIEQMHKDVKLLQRLRIMDYSLLIGIHDLERGNQENLRDKTLQVFQPGGEDAEDPASTMLARTPSKLENARKAKELRQMIKTQKPVPMEKTSNKMPDELQDSKKNFYFYADDGGFRATHEDDSPGDEIYYLGIIDCLTYYSWIKRLEHFFKGLTNTESQISAIPPERYGERFIKFISGVTMTREAAEREKQKEAAEAATDTQTSGVHVTDQDGALTEKVMEKAETQAERSRQRGASEEDVPDRSMRVVRSPSAERGELGTTLPVVEEAAESSSTGGRSGRSTETSLHPDRVSSNEQNGKPVEPASVSHSSEHPHQRRPPTPPKDSSTEDSSDRRPPTPAKDARYSISNRHEGPPTPPKEEKHRGRSLGRDKELPPPPPPTLTPQTTPQIPVHAKLQPQSQTQAHVKVN
ncbi:SAICAR synthase-like protein [Westerdykella ornata]|uniref:1-phosphatidylinositol-4-phosphate 5-kinase n=1 Tax=Westerdykella ornata TaxID=318751 RepID=A0A6A6JPE9_WESOR|nr:SAICAR synthase-like protein [Westerdykella ornata]KAF2278530.1 SAICAR synthase-like protein [Westerdykella ornata]